MNRSPQPHLRDPDALDYVLGTGTREERRLFEHDMAADAGLAAAVRAWEERLSPLAEAVEPVPPSPGLADTLDRAINAHSAPNVRSFAIPPEILRLRRSRRIWRAATAGASAMAAGLFLALMLSRPVPGEFPQGLVAVVNRSGELPALIVRVDQRSGTVQIRSVSADAPSAHSLELWSIAAGGQPRSLGLVGSGVTWMSLPAGRSLDAQTTLAVSVEPAGGSPRGSPTGPVVYSGKLVPELP